MHVQPMLPSRRFLDGMLERAMASDPRDALICPFGEHAYATLFGIIPDVMAVLRTALSLEPDGQLLIDWYVGDPIAQFGGLTAGQMVSLGRAELVLGFLHSLKGDAGTITAVVYP